MNYQLFETAEKVIETLANSLLRYSQQGRAVHISLSGGSTPKQLFVSLASSPYAEKIQWQNLHFWWGDERCVAPNDPESNYGDANHLLFQDRKSVV